MRTFYIISCLFLHFVALGQTDTASRRFNVKVAEVAGDLNSDQIADRVIITQDTSSETAPYRIQIFFSDSKGHLKLQLSTKSAIEPDYPNGRDGFVTGTKFWEVSIKKNVLTVAHELTRGHYEHKYRYQNGDFVLIGFSMVNSDGRDRITTIDFNLLSGLRTEKVERFDIDKVVSFTKMKKLVRPLPKLKDIVPLEKVLF